MKCQNNKVSFIALQVAEEITYRPIQELVHKFTSYEVFYALRTPLQSRKLSPSTCLHPAGVGPYEMETYGVISWSHCDFSVERVSLKDV